MLLNKGLVSFARVPMRPLFAFTLVALCSNVFAQTITFDMSAFGIKFGKMVITRTKENDSTELYSLNAKGYLKVLWMERRDETRQEVRYRNGVLLSSTYTEMETDKVKRWSKITYDGKHHNIDSYKGKRTLTQVPGFSIMKMYFNKPAGLKQIFYEPEGEFVPLIYRDANTVEIKTPEGNRSVYRFEKGQLKEMEFHISIATVYAKRIGD